MIRTEIGRPNEGCYSSRIQRSARAVRLWQQFHHPLHPQGRPPRRNLFQLSSLLYGQAEVDGHRRSCGTLPPQVRQGRRKGGSAEEVASAVSQLETPEASISNGSLFSYPTFSSSSSGVIRSPHTVVVDLFGFLGLFWLRPRGCGGR